VAWNGLAYLVGFGVSEINEHVSSWQNRTSFRKTLDWKTGSIVKLFEANCLHKLDRE
jgi:hypothetical protein